MRKLNKLVVAMTLATVTLFSACSEKETPVPTVNNERLDALRTELRGLQMQVYGEEMTLAGAEGREADLERQIANMTAEIERLKAVYNQEVDYGVFVVDFQNNKLAGATVKVAQKGEVVSATADDNGYVLFENLYSGVIAGVIEAEGYTSANFTAGLYDGETEGVDYASSKVSLLPTVNNANKTGMFTVTGNLYANLSNVNDTLNNWNDNGTAPGPDADNPWIDYDKVTDQNLTFYLYLNEDHYRHYPQAFQNVRSIVYEDAIYPATFKEDGSYVVSLPARGIFTINDADRTSLYQDFSFLVDAQDFMAPYTYFYTNDREVTVTESRFYEFYSHFNPSFGETIQPGETRNIDLYYNSAIRN